MLEDFEEMLFEIKKKKIKDFYCNGNVVFCYSTVFKKM